ncbi:hypothetical protein [Saccharopolyspora pogona]|uniref:hypothetical protein n=1 Tax=Saccharopolyspora pogona TaxID=333966 RepID=UPI00168906B1|nr:hypothetical protein [Saccharopolyspora pogona]
MIGGGVAAFTGGLWTGAAVGGTVRKVIYLTEDETDGCFYRFRPNNWGDLCAGGLLEVLVAGE